MRRGLVRRRLRGGSVPRVRLRWWGGWLRQGVWSAAAQPQGASSSWDLWCRHLAGAVPAATPSRRALRDRRSCRPRRSWALAILLLRVLCASRRLLARSNCIYRTSSTMRPRDRSHRRRWLLSASRRNRVASRHRNEFRERRSGLPPWLTGVLTAVLARCRIFLGLVRQSSLWLLWLPVVVRGRGRDGFPPSRSAFQ